MHFTTSINFSEQDAKILSMCERKTGSNVSNVINTEKVVIKKQK